MIVWVDTETTGLYPERGDLLEVALALLPRSRLRRRCQVSGATIDVTRRTHIRALAARMHRAGIAGVFSVAGGAPVVDEAVLDVDQQAEAARILEEVATATSKIEDVEEALRVAAMIPRYVKPSCSTCGGRAVVRRDGADDVCGCVDRRWQADVDRRAFVDALRAPGRASGVRVESTRAIDAEARVAAAREVLERARAALSAACADLDSAIASREAGRAGYFAERGQLDASRAAFGAQAEEQERLAAQCATSVEDARARAEEIAIQIGQQIGQQIESLFERHPIATSDTGRSRTHVFVDAVYDAASEVARHRADQEVAETAACWARGEERSCEIRIAALDAENVPLVDDIERLRAARARVARHHQPKIDRAERRLRRLVYISSGDSDVRNSVTE